MRVELFWHDQQLLKAYLTLQEGFTVEDMDPNTPARMEPLVIESEHLNIFVNEDGLVEIEAAFSAFDRQEFCNAIGEWPRPLFPKYVSSLQFDAYFFELH